MRKIAIASLVGICVLIGAWAFCLVAAPPWISNFTRGATQPVAHALGITALDEPTGDKAPVKETVSNLPDGYYIYVGPRPMQTATKWVVINPGGTIAWLNPGETAPVDKPTPKLVAGAPIPQPDNSTQFEKYDYPTIKWRAKPLAGADDAIAQLSTTYDRSTTAGQQGAVKYRLTLFKVNSDAAREVQLLDANGFKLFQFNASDFHQIPGSQLMEARDSFSCDEEQYRQARDYSIR